MHPKQFQELCRTIAGGALFMGGVLLTFVAERLGIAACAVGLGLMFIDSLIQCINRTE